MRTKPHSSLSEPMASPWKRKTPDADRQPIQKFVTYDPTEGIEEGLGDCVNTTRRIRRGAKLSIKCLNFNVILGNGYCTTCWDEQVDRQGNNRRERMRGASNKDSKYLPIDITPMG